MAYEEIGRPNPDRSANPVHLDVTVQPDLRNYFVCTAEHVLFAEMGIAEPRIAEYMSDVLVRFVHVDAMWGVKGSNGKPLSDLRQMCEEAWNNQNPPHVTWALSRHIADVALYLSGVGERGRSSTERKVLFQASIDLHLLGKEAYGIAERTAPIERQADVPVFQKLSRDFPMFALGMSEVMKAMQLPVR